MDQHQFRELALRELPAVYRMARHLVLDPHAADDLVQQTYLNALQAADRFQPAGNGGIRAWLYKILHNLQRNRLKRLAREPTSIGDGEGVAQRQSEYERPRDLGGLDWDQVDERLKQAIHSLPDGMRSVFLLVAVERMKYREVADILQLPVGTVMSTLFRARARLLAMLADLAGERRLRPQAPQDEQSSGLECC